MKVLYDHQAFVMQKRGGVSRYFNALIRGVRGYENVSVDLSVTYSNNIYLKPQNPLGDSKQKERDISYVLVLLKKIFRKSRIFLRVHDWIKKRSNKIFSLQKIKKGNFDVFHPTYYDPYFLRYIKNKPYVLTIHDMIHEIYPEFFSLNDQTSNYKKMLALRAKKIIAISENTKKDIVKYLNIEANKIAVIHHANYISSQQDIEVETPQEFVLFVGGRKRWKNFNFFLACTAEIFIEHGVSLVCVGDPFDKEEEKLIDSLGMTDIVYSKQVNDDELSQLYKKAMFFVFPSLYEGFGIPILEAFSNSCPVALSNTSCFPEIAQDAALYFDPKNKESIVSAMLKFIQNKSLREEMVKKGSRRVKNFTLENMCLQTMNVYKSVL